MLLLIFAAFGASATALISPRLRARPTAVANNRAAPIVPAPLASRRLATIVRASPVAEQPTVNTGLVRSMVLNQIVVGYSLWLINGSGREIFTSQAHFGPVSLALGILGSLPIIAAGRAIEKSDAPIFAGLNLSTNLLVLRLFGPRPQPVFSFVVCFLICALTGITEETVFRGVVFQNCLGYVGGDVPLGAAAAVALFALGHINPLALGPGTAVLFGLQLATGASFTLLYLLTGNLAVPIVAHCLYDLYTFYETHLVVTTQMEYASGTEDPTKRTFRMMDANRDGMISPKELRVGLYSFGVSSDKQAALDVFKEADTDASGGLDFNEFAAFVESNGGEESLAIKRSLLGARM